LIILSGRKQGIDLLLDLSENGAALVDVRLVDALELALDLEELLNVRL